MRGDVLHTIAISAWGSAFLNRPSNKAPELLGSCPAFTGVSECAFERGGSGLFKGRIAESIAPWLKRMYKDGAPNVRFFPNGVGIDAKISPAEWGYIIDGDHGLEVWVPSTRPRVLSIGEGHNVRLTYTSDRYPRFSLKPPIAVATELQGAMQIWLAAKEAVSGSLPAHANLIHDVIIGNTTHWPQHDLLSSALPNSWSRSAYEEGLRALRIAWLMTDPAWDSTTARRMAGEVLQKHSELCWSSALNLMAALISDQASYSGLAA